MTVKEGIPPHSLEHEMCLLGAMLLDRDCIADILPRIAPDDFYRSDHRTLYKAMTELYGANRPVDLVTTPEKLRVMGTLEQVGGVGYLAELAECVPSAANAVFYAEVVAEHSARRRTIVALEKALKTAWGAKDDPDANLERVQEQVAEAVKACRRGSGGVPLIQSVRHLIAELRKPPEERTGVRLPWGIRAVDLQSGGLFGGELTVIGARTRIGKTAAAVQVAAHVASLGHPGLYFSREMGPAMLAGRAVVHVATGNLYSQSIRTGELSTAEFGMLDEAADHIARLPITVDYNTSSASGIYAASAAAVARGCKLIVVDFLGLIDDPPDMKHDNKATRVAANVVKLQRVAIDFNIPVLLLVQLSRGAEGVSTPPSLADLKESGAIEECARQVLFLHCPDVEKARDRVQWIIAKNSQGMCGTIDLRWDGHRQRYWDPAEPVDEVSPELRQLALPATLARPF